MTRPDAATQEPSPARQKSRANLALDMPLIDDVPPALLVVSVIVSGLGFLLAYLLLPPLENLCADAFLIICLPSLTYSQQTFRRDVWPIWRNTATCFYLYNLPERYADRLTPPWARFGAPTGPEAEGTAARDALNAGKSE